MSGKKTKTKLIARRSNHYGLYDLYYKFYDDCRHQWSMAVFEVSTGSGRIDYLREMGHEIAIPDPYDDDE